MKRVRLDRALREPASEHVVSLSVPVRGRRNRCSAPGSGVFRVFVQVSPGRTSAVTVLSARGEARVRG